MGRGMRHQPRGCEGAGHLRVSGPFVRRGGVGRQVGSGAYGGQVVGWPGGGRFLGRGGSLSRRAGGRASGRLVPPPYSASGGRGRVPGGKPWRGDGRRRPGGLRPHRRRRPSPRHGLPPGTRPRPPLALYGGGTRRPEARPPARRLSDPPRPRNRPPPGHPTTCHTRLNRPDGLPHRDARRGRTPEDARGPFTASRLVSHPSPHRNALAERPLLLAAAAAALLGLAALGARQPVRL